MIVTRTGGGYAQLFIKLLPPAMPLVVTYR
jgi:hypothetical protein